MILEIGAAAHATIEAHLRRAYPEEGCGVLIGADHEDRRIVARAIVADNVSADARGNRYLIAPERLLEIERDARAQGLEVLGFFHSHPDHPARPSAFDLEHAWPYYSYLIVSVRHGEVAETRSWRLAADRTAFDSESIELRPGEDLAGGRGEDP